MVNYIFFIASVLNGKIFLDHFKKFFTDMYREYFNWFYFALLVDWGGGGGKKTLDKNEKGKVTN